MQNDSSLYHSSRLNGNTSEHSRHDFIDKLRPCINYLLPLPLHLNFSRKETTIVLNLAKYFFLLSQFPQLLVMVFINALKKTRITRNNIR